MKSVIDEFGFMLVLSVLYLAYLIIWIVFARYCLLVNAWPRVEAEVLKREVLERPAPRLFERKYALDIVYCYRVDGNVYDGSRISVADFSSGYDMRFIAEHYLERFIPLEQQIIEISYNPKNPSSSYIDGDTKYAAVACIIIGLAPLIFVLGMNYLSLN